MTDQNQQSMDTGRSKSDNTGENHAPKNNRRGRYHRHHKHNRNTAPEHENTAQKAENHANTEKEKTEKAVETHPAERENHQNKKGDRNRNHKNNKKEKTDGNNQRGQNRRFNHESRPYDPYETPSREEIALSQLRAQIVLKSADGTVPTAYGTQPSAVAESPVEKTAEEPSSVPATDSDSTEAFAPIEETPLEAAEPENVPMVEVVGIRFRSAGKMYYFDPHGIQVKKGSSAIVETTRGPEFGDVCLANTMIRESNVVSPLRPLIRIATPEDVAQNASNREKEKEALKICQEKIEKHGLEMKLIDVQYAFDASKLLFYFAAEGRVDFRELVKDLASVFRTRIELRQIGIRDEAKMLGGIGACGRPLCCSTFLPDFAQVSIKMAKDQNLSLNSSKISGLCGRLMCCLRYESEVYAEEIKKTPSNDTLVRTEDGVGVVIGSNPLAGTIRVVLKDNPDTAPKQYHRDAVTVIGKEKRNSEPQNNDQTEN